MQKASNKVNFDYLHLRQPENPSWAKVNDSLRAYQEDDPLKSVFSEKID